MFDQLDEIYISGADAGLGAGAAPPRIVDQLHKIYISGAGAAPPKIVDRPHEIYISPSR